MKRCDDSLTPIALLIEQRMGRQLEGTPGNVYIYHMQKKTAKYERELNYDEVPKV